MKGWIWRGCWPSGEVGKGWQGVAVGKKYKNGTGNWEIFSWNEPTGRNGALSQFKLKKFTVVHKSVTNLFAVCVNSITCFV